MKFLSFFLHRNQFVKGYVAALICIFGIGVIQISQISKLTAMEETKSTYAFALKKDIESERVHLKLLQNFPSFGFGNLVADWSFLKFLQYFGNESARAKTGYDLSPEYFEVIINRDPRFLETYLFLSTSITLYAGQPQKTVTLIEEGLQSISPEISRKSPYLWMYKGSDEMLFLGDTEAAQHSYEMAAKWAETYDNPQSQSLAANARQTAQFLANNSQSKQARVGAWSMILSNAPNEATRQRAIKEIEALGGEVIVTPQGKMKVKTP